MKKELNCILMVDDNEADNRYHQILFKKLNITAQIHVVENGLEAITYLKQCRVLPELIFLDINMPKMNGWEFLEVYKKLDEKQKAQIIIIMLTTSANPDDIAKSKKIQDVTGYIFKPLTRKILTEILEQHFVFNKAEIT